MTEEQAAITAEVQSHNHGVYIADSTWRAVKLIAAQLDRSPNWVVGRALLEYCERNKTQDGGEA